MTGFVKVFLWLGTTFLFAYLFGGRLPYFVFYFSLIIVLFSFMWSRKNLGLQVSCSTETASTQTGARVRLFVEVTNPSSWPVPWVQLWVKLPGTFLFPDNMVCYTVSLSAKEKRIITDEMECLTRGRYTWGKVLVKTGDFLGVFSRTTTTGKTRELVVYPQICDLGNDLGNFTGRRFGEGQTCSHAGRRGTEYFGVRKYDSSDGVSRIHWKATARTQHLLVKEMQEHRTMECQIVLDLNRECSDLGPGHPLVEKAVTLAASLAAAGARGGYGVGLVLNGVEFISIPAGYGKGHLNVLLEKLLTVQPAAPGGSSKGFPELAGRDKNKHVFVITMGMDTEMAENLKRLKLLGKMGTVFIMSAEAKACEPAYFGAAHCGITALRDFGIPVYVVNQSTDLCLLFRGLEYGAV